jgi:hypothetical protein
MGINELELLRIVFSERKPNWGGKNKYTYSLLRRDLGVAGRAGVDLSDSEI